MRFESCVYVKLAYLHEQHMISPNFFHKAPAPGLVSFDENVAVSYFSDCHRFHKSTFNGCQWTAFLLQISLSYIFSHFMDLEESKSPVHLPTANKCSCSLFSHGNNLAILMKRALLNQDNHELSGNACMARVCYSIVMPGRLVRWVSQMDRSCR